MGVLNTLDPKINLGLMDRILASLGLDLQVCFQYMYLLYFKPFYRLITHLCDFFTIQV